MYGSPSSVIGIASRVPRMVRVGVGFDMHRLVSGRPLILGGVAIPFERGLDGDSDADVLTHAILDALLGAAGLGDIGTHFGVGRPENMGISSLLLLERVVAPASRSGVPGEQRGCDGRGRGAQDRSLHSDHAGDAGEGAGHRRGPGERQGDHGKGIGGCWGRERGSRHLRPPRCFGAGLRATGDPTESHGRRVDVSTCRLVFSESTN